MKSKAAPKEARLHIRTSPSQKALLAQAARARHLKVSQFVLQTCLEAAEKVVREEEEALATIPTVIPVSAEEFAWLMEKLEEPPQEVPALRRLLAEAPVWNG
ncbi:MAG: DUF1778 domain-containing protein [Armatimonadota bacterium]|nr:DUF1778 domain-containing protein [Armatimonadota bacterium]